MRHITVSCLALALLSAVARAQTASNPPAASPANIGSWQQVQALPDGVEITVASAHRRTLRCFFAGADDSYLFCDPPLAWAGRHGYRFDRSQVAAVRISHTRRNAHILVGGMAAAGFVAGVALSESPASGDTTPRVIRGVELGGIGAFAGLLASPFMQFIPGDLIYQAGTQQPHAISATNGRPSCSGR